MREQVESRPQPGNDGVLKLMKRLNLPMTRDQYLELAYLGRDIPSPFPIELELSLPQQFQKKS